MDDPRFDWTSSFSTPWNHELASLLAADFLPNLHDSKTIVYPPVFRDVKTIRNYIFRKLRRTRKAYCDKQPPSLESGHTALQKETLLKVQMAARLKAARHISRKAGVGTCLFLALISQLSILRQTFKRRQQIAKERRHLDPPFWDRTAEVIEYLGAQGMSSDETVQEARGMNPKVVRRIPKPWLHTDVSSLLAAIDEQGSVVTPSRGGKTVLRLRAPDSRAGVTMRSESAPVCKLPANYYDEMWWRSLSNGQQLSIQRRPGQPLPDAVRLEILLRGRNSKHS